TLQSCHDNQIRKAPPMLTPAEIQNIRSRFPILRHKTYASSCSQGALSTGVEAALREYITSWHEYGTPWDRWVAKYEEARAAFAAFIGASPDEVAITSCASAAINSIASALRFDRRRKVVLGEFEFPTAAYESAVDGGTAIVPVTRICFTNGFRSDVQQITQIAHARGAYVLLDDYQDAGTRPIDVKALGVDFYVTGTLKYLLGPS